MAQPWLQRLLALALLLLATVSYGALPDQVDGKPLPTLAPMLERVLPAVVNISTETRIQVPVSPLYRDPFFRRFFDLPQQPRERRSQSLGSGVIVDAEAGYILTNHHVIEGADKIEVTLYDGRVFEAGLIGSDPDSDVAVIRIPADSLSAIARGDSSILKVGDFVVAVGNPFGLGQTVTSGIISGLKRNGLGIENYEDYIQTDASINVGNSGGALVNLRGELVGINTAIIAPGGGSVGIGFAIPVNMALSLMGQIVEFGKIRRGRLGVVIQNLTPDLAQAFGLPDTRGAVIAQVLEGSAASDAGIREGDVVVQVGERSIHTGAELRNVLGLLRHDQDVELKFYRDGEQRTVITRVRLPDLETFNGGTVNRLLRGVIFQETDDLPAGNGEPSGILVTDIEQRSRAYQAGLRTNDLVIAVNRQPVNTIEDMDGSVDRNRQGISLFVNRDNRGFTIVIQ